MKKLALIVVLACATGAAMAGTLANPCGDDVNCWREWALLSRTQAQNAAGLYWKKVEMRAQQKSVGAAEPEPCTASDIACWKQLAKTARAADKAMSALDGFDTRTDK